MKSKSEDWDFVVSGKVLPPSKPIIMVDNETNEERFERFARCISRCVVSCSLCEAGLKRVKYNNVAFDPHVSNSLEYREIVIIKYEPDFEDYNRGLFNNDDYRQIYKDIGVSIKDFYITTIIKCKDGDKSCPFFDMEYRSNFPKLVIVTDKKSADHLGIEYKIGEFTTGFWGEVQVKMFCTDGPDTNFVKMVKLFRAALTQPTIRNRLFQS